MTGWAEGQRVKSWLGAPGKVVHQTLWGRRAPQPMIRFDGRLTYHRPWVSAFVHKVGASR